MILAIEAIETFLLSSAWMSCSLPSSLVLPRLPLGRPSSLPAAFAVASPSMNAGAIIDQGAPRKRRFLAVQN